MLVYVTGIKIVNFGRFEEEITHYRLSSVPENGGQLYSKEEFFSRIYSELNQYRTYNPLNGRGTSVERKRSSKGEYYLQSVPNSTVADNLLSLPRC